MISPETRNLHLQLSRHAARLLDFTESHPECLDRPDQRRGLPDWVAAYRGTIQFWPALVGGEKLAQMRRAALAVPRLVKSIPARIFGNDAAAIARFYGVAEEAAVRAMFEAPDGLPEAISRGDYLDTAEGWKCLELNLSAALGGWQIRFFVEPILAQPWLQELLSGVRSTYVDPLPELFAHVVRRALASPLGEAGEVNIALLMPAPLFAQSDPSFAGALAGGYQAFLAAAFPGVQGSLTFSTYDRLRAEGEQVFLGDTRLHAILDYHDPFFDSYMDEAVLKSFKARGVHLYNSPAACLLSDKRNIALLSEHQESDLFSPEEREEIRAFIPWSRLARLGSTDFRGERVDLPSFVLAERERLILKSGRGGQGDSVVPGCKTSPEEWARIAEEAFTAGDWIVQEKLEPLPYWFQAGESGAAPHEVVWGLFEFGGRYGGSYMRMLPQGNVVVSGSLGAAHGLVLEVED